MSYYDTIEEDLKRAKAILAKGRGEHADELRRLVGGLGTDRENQEFGSGGTISGADIYAAYKLLESFVAELTNFLQLFSDYEEPCQGYDHAQAIWNAMKERENRLHEKIRQLEAALQEKQELVDAVGPKVCELALRHKHMHGS